MPGDERYRAWAMAPRPHRILHRHAHAPGEVTLILVPERSLAATVLVPTVALPGQYWILHTASGAQIPAVTGGRPVAVDAPDDSLEATTLRMPCGHSIGQVGDMVGVRGPFGIGWDLEMAVGRALLLIAWESGLGLLRSVADQVTAATAAHHGVRVWVGAGPRKAIALPTDRARWALNGAIVTTCVGSGVMMADAAQAMDSDPRGTVALLAGPLALARQTARALVHRGMPAQRIQLAAHPLLRCGTGRCGGCAVQVDDGEIRALSTCQDGPIFTYDRLTTVRGI